MRATPQPKQPSKSQLRNYAARQIEFQHQGVRKQGFVYGAVKLTLLQVTLPGGTTVLVPPANARILSEVK